MDLERLEAALRAAHAAGDTQAAQRFAAEIRRLRAEGASTKHAPPRRAAAATVDGRPVAAELRTAPPPPAAAPASTGAGGTWEPLTARERGRASAQEHGGSAPAAVQGLGSMLFGLGTPITAAGEFLSAALPGGEPAMTPSEALEYARGRREGLAKEYPAAYGAGMVGGLAAGAGAVRGLVKAAPRVASVFTPQAGQTARNIARLAATGATAAGVTAANEEGVGAVPTAAAIGAAAGPVVAGALKVGGAVARGVHSRISPDNAAIRLLARRLGEPVQAITERYNAFRETMGRAPRLVEIMNRHAAEELGQVGRARTAAGEILQNAEEAATLARPQEVSRLIRQGGATTSEPAQQALLPRPSAVTGALRGPRTTEVEARASLDRIRDETTETVGRRVQSTETAQIGRRDVQFDRLMQTIGQHRVPLTDDMLEVIQQPDIWSSLDPALRRRVAGAIEQGEHIGSVDLAVRTWDAIRQELGARAGAGAGQIYARLRDRVTDYVSSAVPEYGAGLREFGRRTDVARGTTAGRRALREDAREFADRLRTAGGGTADIAQRPGVRVAEQAGMRVGARTALANMLSGTEEQARKAMARLAGDRRLQANLRAVLGDAEATELEGLANRYGFQLHFADAVKAGSRLVARGDSEALAAALRAQSTVAGPAGVRAGTRAALADALEGSDENARKMMERLATDEPYRRRVAQGLSTAEAEQLERIGAQYGRRLDILSGVRTGRGVVKQGDSEAFRTAVTQAAANPAEAAGIRAGARGALADAALESPASATRVAQQLTEDPGLRGRIESALGAAEGARLGEIGRTATDAARRLGEAAPARGSLAQSRTRENAENIQQAISAGVIAVGRFSGAFLANFANNVRQKTSLSRRAAQRLAEMAADPDNAHKVIARLRSTGVSPESIARMYREAAQAAGVVAGQE